MIDKGRAALAWGGLTLAIGCVGVLWLVTAKEEPDLVGNAEGQSETPANGGLTEDSPPGELKGERREEIGVDPTSPPSLVHEEHGERRRPINRPDEISREDIDLFLSYVDRSMAFQLLRRSGMLFEDVLARAKNPDRLGASDVGRARARWNDLVEYVQVEWKKARSSMSPSIEPNAQQKVALWTEVDTAIAREVRDVDAFLIKTLGAPLGSEGYLVKKIERDG